MSYNQKNYRKTAATGVFHTDGIGVSPNDPSQEYLGWNNDLVDEGIDLTAGKTTLTQFNQNSQLNTSGNQAQVDSFDEDRAYDPVLRQSS